MTQKMQSSFLTALCPNPNCNRVVDKAVKGFRSRKALRMLVPVEFMWSLYVVVVSVVYRELGVEPKCRQELGLSMEAEYII